MKHVMGLLTLGALLTGCIPYDFNPYATLRSQNRQSLTKVEIGMTKDQVIQVMGSESASLPGDDTFSNPYKKES